MACKWTRQLFPLGLLVSCVLLGCSRDEASHDSASHDSASHDGGTASSEVTPSDSDEDFTHVLTTKTEYYVTGPQQAHPPDGQFEVGLKVKLIEEAGSYSRVVSESGVTAYVAADAIQPIEDK